MKEMMTFNTGETNKSLKEIYNPEGSILRKAQYRMLDMLLYLDKICKKENIIYSLEGGNILGAIRHKGFIPWDDDVDVILPRKDYIKLKKYLEKNPHNQYVLQTHKTDPGYYGSWMVLRDLKSEYIQNTYIHNARKYKGLQIDIFPIEHGYIHVLHRIAAKINRTNSSLYIGRKPFIANIIYHFEQDFLYPIFRIASKIFGNKKYFSYEYGHNTSPKFIYQSVFPLSTILFEGYTFPAPNNCDIYLKSLYKGNYWDLPPIDKRNHHQATYKIED